MAENGNKGQFTAGDPRAGRPKGVPNKATRDVRAAIAAFAEGNIDKLQGWLDRVAVRDPAKAADLFVRVLEYHVPKLARTELSGELSVRGKLIIHD
jgi:hypothetical protein